MLNSNTTHPKQQAWHAAHTTTTTTTTSSSSTNNTTTSTTKHKKKSKGLRVFCKDSHKNLKREGHVG